MIKITKYMSFDGKEFFIKEEAIEYEKSIVPHYEQNLKFKCELPCESFTIGETYPFLYDYVGLEKTGVIVTINDCGKETILGETWLNGVIKDRFSLIYND